MNVNQEGQILYSRTSERVDGSEGYATILILVEKKYEIGCDEGVLSRVNVFVGVK